MSAQVNPLPAVPAVPLPISAAMVAKEFHKIPLQERRIHCTQLHIFLSSQQKDLAIFNCDGNPLTTALVNIPKLNLFCVVYDIRYGTTPIGGASPLSNKLLAFSGDGTTETPPTVLVLPQSIVTKNTIKIPNDGEIYTKRATSNGGNFPMFKNAHVTKEMELMKLMPIPTFLAYNGFEHDLEVLTVYNPVATLGNTGDPYILELLAFLKGCMVSRLLRDPNTYVTTATFMVTASTNAQNWGAVKFKALFPTSRNTGTIPPASSLEATLAALL